MVFICNECVVLCFDLLHENAPPTGAQPLEAKARQGVQAVGSGQVMIRVPDGSVHASHAVSPWKPIVVFRERLEWCAARSPVRGSDPLLLIAVRRRGAEGAAVGAAFDGNMKPTRERAREIAVKYLLGREG
jgi:hypothetical protein